MNFLMELLWAAMMLLFFAGAVTYAVQPELGKRLLKRCGVLLAVLLVGPSLVRTAIGEISPLLLIIGFVAASLGAYGLLSHSGKAAKHRPGSGGSHAERQPLVPHHEEDES